MQYEINYLVLQSKTETLDQIRQAIKSLIERQGGKIEAEKNYLKRKLAYEIKHEGYGFYTVLRFTIEDAQALVELKRELNLDANVARYILVKASELPALDQTPASMENPAEEEKAVDEIIREPKVAVEKPAETVPTPEKTETPAPQAEVKQPETKQPEAETEAAKEEPTKQPEKKEDGKTTDDGKASLEDLDKKLDEILNI